MWAGLTVGVVCWEVGLRVGAARCGRGLAWVWLKGAWLRVGVATGRGSLGCDRCGRSLSDPLPTQLACTVVAILLQFLHLSAVGWALLEALHLYRRRTEPRHVDRGPMRFYHVLGWGLPAFITGELTPLPTYPNPAPRSPPQPVRPHPNTWLCRAGGGVGPRGLREPRLLLALHP